MPTTKQQAFDLLDAIAKVMGRYPDAVPAGTTIGYHLPHVLMGAVELVQAERVMRKWNTAACNGFERWDAKAGRMLPSWTEDDDAKAEKAIEKAQSRARHAFARIFGPRWAETFDAEFQRDPRGAMIKLHEKGRRDSGWAVLTV